MKSDDLLFSFIIPVYNTQNYIHECVHSLLNQSYKNFEILLIDDGSTDNSPEICDELSNNSKIVTYHKINGGLSDARNYGLFKATGQYVIFIDSDDFWINTESLQQIKELLKAESFDFIGFNCAYYYDNSKSFKYWPKYCDNLLLLQDKNLIIHELVRLGVFPMSACLKVINRKFLISNELFFQKGYYSEDIPWFIDLLSRVNKMKLLDEYIYAYRQNVSSSITASFSEKKFSDLLHHVESIYYNINQYEFDDQAKNAIMSFLAYEYCILKGQHLCLSNGLKDKYVQRLLNLSFLLDYQLNPKVRFVNKILCVLGERVTFFLIYIFLLSKTNRGFAKILWYNK